jgi:tetratricopeptide (TPR) repeat protein
MPDISVLPALASIFDVTTDFLLGVNEENKVKRKGEFGNKFAEYWRRGSFDEMIELCRKAVAEFPNDYYFTSCLITSLQQKSHGIKDESEKKKYYSEIKRLNERILVYCTDESIRCKSIIFLAQYHKKEGDDEKALEYVRRLPDFFSTHNYNFPLIIEGKNKLIYLRDSIQKCLQLITNQISHLAHYKKHEENDPANGRERIELYEKIIAVIDTVFEQGGHYSRQARVYTYYLPLAEEYLLLNECGKALDCMEKYAENYIAYCDLPDDFVHESVIFKGCVNRIRDNEREKKHMVKDRLLADKYAPLHGHERFKAVIARLEEYAAQSEC